MEPVVLAPSWTVAAVVAPFALGLVLGGLGAVAAVGAAALAGRRTRRSPVVPVVPAVVAGVAWGLVAAALASTGGDPVLLTPVRWYVLVGLGAATGARLGLLAAPPLSGRPLAPAGLVAAWLGGVVGLPLGGALAGMDGPATPEVVSVRVALGLARPEDLVVLYAATGRCDDAARVQRDVYRAVAPEGAAPAEADAARLARGDAAVRACFGVPEGGGR